MSKSDRDQKYYTEYFQSFHGVMERFEGEISNILNVYIYIVSPYKV